MKPAGALLLLSSALLTCCAKPAPQPVVAAQPVKPDGTCRVGLNDGKKLTERGIGGTGTPAETQTADRGIGGTGIKPSAAEQNGDRAGIVGVVTGFASICLDGLEVGFDSTVTVDIDGTAATTGQFRAGQLALVTATVEVNAPLAAVPVTTQTSGAAIRPPYTAAAFRAKTISVRYEVSGPIEAVDAGSGSLQVAGQRVTLDHTVRRVDRHRLGDWVSVSGLRRAGGTIEASRLDNAPVGSLMVRGQVGRQSGTPNIGSLLLVGPKAAAAAPGQFVTVVGRYRAGAAEVVSVAPDRLRSDPAG